MAGYSTDLTNKEWQIIQPYFPRAKKRRAPFKHSMKDSVNAVFYVLKAGCAWGLLPNDFPPKATVYGRFREWKINGLWGKIHNKLHTMLREKEGKKIKGRKRHIMVDVLGLVIAVLVTSANTGDRKAAQSLFHMAKTRFPCLEKVWADGSYTGPLINIAKSLYGLMLEVIKPIDKESGFHVRPWSWRVERTFAWLAKNPFILFCPRLFSLV